jgi:hypothetical protein
VQSTLAEIDADAGETVVELLGSTKCTHETLGTGVETRRRFHFGSRLPSVVQAMLGGRKSLVVEEKASTYYPYVEAIYTCPLFGERFTMTIQTGEYKM